VEGRDYIAPTDVLQVRGVNGLRQLNAFINDQVPNGANGALRGQARFVADNTTQFTGSLRRLESDATPDAQLGLRYENNGVPRDEGLQH